MVSIVQQGQVDEIIGGRRVIGEIGPRIGDESESEDGEGEEDKDCDSPFLLRPPSPPHQAAKSEIGRH